MKTQEEARPGLSEFLSDHTPGDGKQNLYAALRRAREAVSPVTRDASYEWGAGASAEAIFDEARAALFTQKLLVDPIAVDVLPGPANRPWIVRTFRLHHEPSGEQESRRFVWPLQFGGAFNEAYAAALTTSHRYFLRDLLLISQADISPGGAALAPRSFATAEAKAGGPVATQKSEPHSADVEASTGPSAEALRRKEFDQAMDGAMDAYFDLALAYPAKSNVVKRANVEVKKLETTEQLREFERWARGALANRSLKENASSDPVVLVKSAFKPDPDIAAAVVAATNEIAAEAGPIEPLQPVSTQGVEKDLGF